MPGQALQNLGHLHQLGHLGPLLHRLAEGAAYGHFGRPPEPDGAFSWERLDLVAQLKSAFA